MGCDIHTMAEINADVYVPPAKEGEQGTMLPDPDKWKAIKDQVFPNPYFNEKEPVSRWNEPFTSSPYSGRNYALFSLLANVRNYRLRDIFGVGHPYADGTLDRDGITPIMEPRGVPENASKAWCKYVARWGADLHSTSWFTLQELMDAEAAGLFDQTVVQRGWVTLRDYLAHKNEGQEIESWSGGVGGGGIRTILEAEWITLDPAEKEELIQASVNDQTFFAKTYIGYEWKRDLAPSFAEFREKTMPALMANAPFVWNPEYLALDSYAERQAFEGEKKLHDPTRIRIVFGFDN